MIRICKEERFIPKSGNPVYQIQEEADFNGTLQLLPPRQPTSEELEGFNNAFAAKQLEVIAEITAERDAAKARVTELEQQLATKTTEATTLATEKQSLTEQVNTLQSQIDELLNPPSVTQVTPAQMRVWLVLNVGPTVLDNIDAMLNAIPDEAQRKIAKIKWEYGITVLRNDPLVVQFAQALGFNDEQMDAAFLQASQIG